MKIKSNMIEKPSVTYNIELRSFAHDFLKKIHRLSRFDTEKLTEKQILATRIVCHSVVLRTKDHFI